MTLDLKYLYRGCKTILERWRIRFAQSIKNGQVPENKKLSKIGSFENTFYEIYKWIPESLFDKLTPDELANLVDSFYDCYSAGKNAR